MHQQAHQRPNSRRLSSYDTHLATPSSSSGPYLSVHVGATGSASKRTSQTFRPSPLAGPVLSYASLSALDTSTSSSTISLATSTVHADADKEKTGETVEEKTKRSLTFRSTSAEAVGVSGRTGGLSPPGWKRTSLRPVVRVDSTSSKRLSTSSSSPTLSSLISQSLTEGQSHYHHPSSPSSSSPSSPHSPYSPRSSRGSLPMPSASRSLSTSSSTASLKSVGSIGSVGSSRSSTSIGAAGNRGGEKDNDGSSLRGTPAERHDWLTASPTPVFSRSALRSQGIVMPVSARERSRTSSAGSGSRPNSRPVSMEFGLTGNGNGKGKESIEGTSMEVAGSRNGKEAKEKEKGGEKKTGLARRLTQRSFGSLKSMKSAQASTSASAESEQVQVSTTAAVPASPAQPPSSEKMEDRADNNISARSANKEAKVKRSLSLVHVWRKLSTRKRRSRSPSTSSPSSTSKSAHPTSIITDPAPQPTSESISDSINRPGLARASTSASGVSVDSTCSTRTARTERSTSSFKSFKSLATFRSSRTDDSRCTSGERCSENESEMGMGSVMVMKKEEPRRKGREVKRGHKQTDSLSRAWNTLSLTRKHEPHVKGQPESHLSVDRAHSRGRTEGSSSSSASTSTSSSNSSEDSATSVSSNLTTSGQQGMHSRTSTPLSSVSCGTVTLECSEDDVPPVPVLDLDSANASTRALPEKSTAEVRRARPRSFISLGALLRSRSTSASTPVVA